MSCHGAGRWARTARYSGCSKKPWRGGFSRRRSGKAGHGVEPAPVDGERAHAVEGRGLPVDGASGRPGGAPGELVLADLVRGERGSPHDAAEERGEMSNPAAGGADGPELPHLIVLEVGVAEISQGRPLGGERARRRCRRAGGTGRGGRGDLVRGHGLGPSLVAAAGRRRSSTFALVGATGKGNVRRRRDGDVWGATSGGRVHMYGARIRPVLPPHRAARQERERRARPRRRLRHPPARPADEQLADRDPRPRLAVLARTIRRVGGPDHEPMLAGRDRPAGQAACVEPDGPVDADGDQTRDIDDAHHPAFLPGGEAARPWDAATGARVRRPRRRRCSWPRLVAPSPAIAAPASLAACRCRCRRPRTVCVVPRER